VPGLLLKKMENQIILKTPLDEDTIRTLKVGDKVLISGIIYTARDQVHKFLFENKPEEFKEILNGAVVYHCGPIVKDNRIISAGPTTSIREEPYEADLINHYNIRAVIGKGGMGEKTLKALGESGAVYLAATGGAGALLADSIKEIKSVRFEEFGTPESMWELRVEHFPAIVSMDSHGKSLHDEVLKSSREKL
jgi:tartrate/fumarate subfamily iron-sulfur-dependent hydro-lyase beta chain